MSEEIELKVKSAVAEQLDVNIEDIKSDSSFINDLGADSLDLVELVMNFENDFDITIPDDDSSELTTVQKAVDYIKSKLES
ncbi:acyl carrier protein [Psychrobacter sp. YP14]|uniref:Acyl carrier protein n=3 Tax=Psychrobacter TaxID=497 RepID=A0A844LX48_9GAMM|nr:MULTISPECIES: acyl carrier protein [Psychrobacter]AWT48488.1 acyl carrier protein [Psychrobacter sp. YP14]MUG31362.1 acyl carrier protein [Psychrobacter sanguinis]UNK05777.1 acyl carrier protein [Psychrobacter sp. PraFG1]